MKSKTIDQLKEKILALESERDTLEKSLESANHKFTNVLYSLLTALKFTLKHEPTSRHTLDLVLIAFIVELRDKTGIELHQEVGIDEILSYFKDYNQVISEDVKQNIYFYFEIINMVCKGNSVEELIDFLTKWKSRCIRDV